MKKSELKNGCVVELRNGKQYIKINEALINIENVGWLDLDVYDDEKLTYENSVKGAEYKRPEFDIVKVDNSNHLITNWTWEREGKSILTDKEKAYLKAVIEPVKDRVKYIRKRRITYDFIYIGLDKMDGFDCMFLYEFTPNSEFKGMELGKEYTLKELDLE